jgi:hypothetical protein
MAQEGCGEGLRLVVSGRRLEGSSDALVKSMAGCLAVVDASVRKGGERLGG